ncbi:MAG: DUF692 family multinuclear iron-containing protein [Hyphomicrobiaceae bacterium]
MSTDHPPASRAAPLIPHRTGVGLKPEHYRDILDSPPSVGWFEVHPENYMGAGGPPHHYLERIRSLYPISLHGVGLSIGGAGRLSTVHLRRLKHLVDRYDPGLFSEHLAWSTHETTFLNDLLPLPYTRESLAHVAAHVDEVQEAIGRSILIENPSTYVTFPSSEMSEIEFLSELAARTGCGLLLDVNNAFASATNHGIDAAAYIDAFPAHIVGEVHLAGHAEIDGGDATRLLVDAHDRHVADPVWSLYRRLIQRSGPLPTLIEWDNDIPDWPTLAAEARLADDIMQARRRNHAHTAP